MLQNNVDFAWVLGCAIIVFFMQGGFLALEAGLTRAKNSINVAIKNLSDFAVTALAFWLVGFGVMYGPSLGGIVGIPTIPFSSKVPAEMVFFIFSVMFCGTATTIISGAVAERMRFSAYLATALLTGLVFYPTVGHWVWSGILPGQSDGWLRALGFVDFAGSTVVHSVGGWIALAAILVIGPRRGRFQEDGRARRFSGNNLPLAMFGVIGLWFGWFGFNGGSTLALNDMVAPVLLNTLLGGAAGLAGAVVTTYLLGRVPDVLMIMNGTLGGLVAVTAGAPALPGWAAVLAGFLAAPIVAGASHLLERYRIDDAVGAVPVHLAAGIWGTLALGLFGDLEAIGTGLDRWSQIGIQALGIVVIGTIVFSLCFLVLWVASRAMSLRVSPWAEEIGLNVAEHNFTGDLQNLFDVMQTQARTRDFNLRAPQEPFTEIGQIGMFYNTVVYEFSRASDEIERQRGLMEDSHRRAESLLLNVLPKSIAERLQSGERTIAQGYEEVAVLFADIAGFTGITRQFAPSSLVQLLDILFSAFDTLAEKNRLEKIKTIGDAYMVVSGMPDRREDFTRAVANMGLAMVAFCEEISRAMEIDLRLRVGIHVGPVVGGVIGRRRFIFDVWGDTVNVASRLESSGSPGRVQVSQPVVDRIADIHAHEYRGSVEVKGLGPMETYWLNDRRPEERRRAESLDVARQVIDDHVLTHIEPKLSLLLRAWLAGADLSKDARPQPPFLV